MAAVVQGEGQRPWESLPPEVAATLRPELSSLADEIVAAIRAEIPAYGTGALPPRLRVGVEEALRQFVETIGAPEGAAGAGDRGAGREVYVGLGRGEMRAGRGLDALLAAYRLGARIAWRRLAAAGTRAELPPQTMYRLAEAIFASIDELSAESAEGHAQEQSAVAGEAQRRRRRLVTLMVRSPAPDAATIEEAAAEARWPPPGTLAVLAAATEEPERLATRLGAGVIAARVDDLACALVPDPDAPGRRPELKRAFASGVAAALGPTVAWRDAAVSYERARDALGLIRDGAIVGGDLVSARDHAVDILALREQRLLRDRANELLAPLDDLTPAARARLRATLAAWLRHQGRLDPVAAELHVHPQTVRYRLGRLREQLGDLLEDPERRLELELGMRAERIAAPG